MKRHALIVLLGAIALLVAALAPPGGAAAQPQPTMVLSPASGPCDATVQASGTGFPVGNLVLYLVRPGTTDVNMGILNGAVVHPEGEGSSLSQAVPLWNHGCEAATLDSQLAQPTGYLAIAAALAPAPGGGAVQPGERIPNIIAVADYRYTTTTPPPPPVMAISPSSGPCDGTVEVTGTGFQPDQDVSLHWAYPSSEGPEGTLTSLKADAQGAFVVQVDLGETGCAAARTYPVNSDPMPPRLRIDAEAVGLPLQVGSALAHAVYTLTTTEIGATPPQALPATGKERSTPPMWLLLVGGLGAVGLLLVAGLLYRSRRLRS